MKTLIDKYFAGLTSPEEEAQLLQELRREACPSHEQLVLMSMLSPRVTEPRPEWLEEDESEVFDRLVAQRRVRLRWRWAAVAAAACIAVGLFIALPRHKEAKTYAMATIYGEEIHDEAIVMSMMEGTLRSALAQPATNRVEGQMSDLLNH